MGGRRPRHGYPGHMSTLKDKASQLLNGRLEALEDLEEPQARIEAARRELADAEASLLRAWDGAVNAGWTPQELKSIGVSEPTRRRPGRPRGTTRKRAAGATPTGDGAVTNREGQHPAPGHTA